MSLPEGGDLAYDTERQYLGTVYAKGLLGAGRPAGDLSGLVDEVESVVDVVGRLPKLRLLLESPRIPLETKESVIDRAFAGGSDVLRRFLKVLCVHGRFDCLRIIARTARRMVQEENRLVEVLVTSAEAIPDSLEATLSDKLSAGLGKQVVIRKRIDPEIIGGLVVQVGDTVFDASIANQLDRVRRTTLDRTVQAIRQTLDRFAVEA